MITPDWKTQTDVGVTVAVAVGVGRGVSVGGTGVGGTEVSVNVSVGTEEGVAWLFGILQPEIVTTKNRKSEDFKQRIIDMSTQSY